jgi:hypothetical protein
MRVKEQQRARKAEKESQGAQLGLFAAHHPLVDELARIETDSMTPLDALTALSRLVSRARQG